MCSLDLWFCITRGILLNTVFSSVFTTENKARGTREYTRRWAQEEMIKYCFHTPFSFPLHKYTAHTPFSFGVSPGTYAAHMSLHDRLHPSKDFLFFPNPTPIRRYLIWRGKSICDYGHVLKHDLLYMNVLLICWVFSDMAWITTDC